MADQASRIGHCLLHGPGLLLGCAVVVSTSQGCGHRYGRPSVGKPRISVKASFISTPRRRDRRRRSLPAGNSPVRCGTCHDRRGLRRGPVAPRNVCVPSRNPRVATSSGASVCSRNSSAIAPSTPDVLRELVDQPEMVLDDVEHADFVLAGRVVRAHTRRPGCPRRECPGSSAARRRTGRESRRCRSCRDSPVPRRKHHRVVGVLGVLTRICSAMSTPGRRSRCRPGDPRRCRRW